MDNLSVVVSYDDIKTKNYSLSAGQYFEIKNEYVDITKDDFQATLTKRQEDIKNLFERSKLIESEITKSFNELVFNDE